MARRFPFGRRNAAQAAVVATALGFAVASIGARGAAPGIPEPATVFYGKITGTGSDRPFPVTEGELQWTIQQANGASLKLRSRLRQIGDSEFSYRLAVPHEALAAGLLPNADAIPLRTTEESHSHARITINGVEARIAGPGAETFDADQWRRAATYRLDLEVPLEAEDADGNGIPDWWEKLHGLHESDDPDPDGDGVSNRDEYLAGTDPRQSERSPSLATRKIVAYGDALNGVYLRAVDADSSPAEIVYTLIAPPQGAELRLVNAQTSAAAPDVALGAGATWTQADVENGRLVLRVSEASTAATEFVVTLRDAPDATPSEPRAVEVAVHRPSAAAIAALSAEARADIAQGGPAPGSLSASEALILRRWLQGVELGAVVWDLTGESSGLRLSQASAGANGDHYASLYGPAPSSVVEGGAGADVLRGGLSADTLAGGPGDDTLTGGGGGDRFVVTADERGTDTITDFDPAEGDILDFRPFLSGISGDLRDHLEVVAAGGDALVRAKRSPSGPVAALRLAGVAAASVDLREGLERGWLQTGGLDLPPIVVWETLAATASENGPTEARLVARRSGSTAGAIVIPLTITGSAVNGVDYATVSGPLTLPAGASTAELVIRPFPDALAEPEETIEITLGEGAGYALGAARVATVRLADLKPVLSVEALEPVATLEPASQGTFLLRRVALVDRSVLVRLDVRGSATAGSDYANFSRFVNFAPGQDTALIAVQPLAGAELSGGAETVELSVVADPSYLIDDNASLARVTLIDRATSFAAWRAAHFPGETGSLDAFAAGDAGGRGVSNLLRYALGLDPDQPDKARLPRVSVRDGRLTIDVWRNPKATDVEFVAEVSTGLATWTADPDLVRRVYPSGKAGDAGYLCFQLAQPVSGAPQLFVNIRVALRP